MAEDNKISVPPGASSIVPPVWFLLSVVMMAVIGYLLPGRQIIAPPYSYFGGVLFVAGLALAVYAKRQFDVVRTPVRPFTKSTHVVATGPFRFSRNPMYLAMVLGLVAVGIGLGKIAPFVMVPLFIMWIRSRFIRFEEQAMEARFGEEYVAYKNRVRRWI